MDTLDALQWCFPDQVTRCVVITQIRQASLQSISQDTWSLKMWRNMFLKGIEKRKIYERI